MSESLKNAKAMAEAHTSLCLFAAIVSLLQSPDIKGASAQRTAEKMVRLARAEEQRQLKLYDKHQKGVTPEPADREK